MFNIKPLEDMASSLPTTGSASTSNMYYPQTSNEVLNVKKSFKLPEKTENIIDEYISKIKIEFENIELVKKQEKEDEINHKAEVLQHVMNQEKIDIGD
jgi:hypothetical protein